MSSSKDSNVASQMPLSQSSPTWQVEDDKTKNMSSKSLLGECFRGLSDLQNAMSQMEEAGLRLTQMLSQVLKNSVYAYVGDALATKMCDVYMCAKSKTGMDIFNEMGSMLMKLKDIENQQRLDPHTYQHTLCHVSLLLIKLTRQYYSICNNRVTDLVHSLLCLRGEEPAAGEVTKLVLKLGLADGLESPTKSNSSLPNTPWGSPKNRGKSRQDLSGKSQGRSGFRIMSLFERKSPSVERSSFYVDVEEELCDNQKLILDKKVPTSTTSHSEGKNNSNLTTSGQDLPHSSSGSLGWAPPSSQDSDNQVKVQSQDNEIDPSSKLASEEDLENIINLLSGVGPSPMQAIPEIPHHQMGGPIQLVVPQIYRLPSPASDTQVEELRSPSRQQPVHRRSEGCLDLSSMWPNHSPHHHHRIINTNQPPPPLGTSLPWVQIHSASSLGSSISECPSPISGYAGDSSPGYAMSSPSPSFPSSPARLPVSTNSNSLGVVGQVPGMRGRSLSPFQQWGGVSGGGGNMFGSGASSGVGSLSPRMPLTPEFGTRQQGTWPMYGAPANQRTMGWSGVHDGSDLSDDSSTEDQFFAVGKDLCHALDSKGGSSDEEGDTTSQLGQAKNSSTWPLSHATVGGPDSTNRGLTPDLLELPDAYQPHRPVQMQWSDPMSSRSMWPSGSLDPSQRKTSQSMYGFGGMP